MLGFSFAGRLWLRWLPLSVCLLTLSSPGHSSPLYPPLKNRTPSYTSECEYFCSSGICGENAILNSLPFSKRYEFINHPWEVRDSFVRLGKDESLGIVSLMFMVLVGQGIVNSVGSVSRPVVSLGMQSAVDFALSHNVSDLILRSGTNALSRYISGEKWSWKHFLWFLSGHASLLGVHWQDLRTQVRSQYEGQRRIHFTSDTMDQLFELVLDVSGSVDQKNGQLIIHFDHYNELPSTIGKSFDTNLEASWIRLLMACRQEVITSIRIRPASNRHVMLVQLWRHDRLLSEIDAQLEMVGDVMGDPVWLTDWLTRRVWPEGWQVGFEPLILPLSEAVLNGITRLVLHGYSNDVIPVSPVAGGVAPEGRMAVFATGDQGYLLVDRNHTKNVELPEMWLNTSDRYKDDMKLSLAQLESHRIPGRERGFLGLGLEVLRSLVARWILAINL